MLSIAFVGLFTVVRAQAPPEMRQAWQQKVDAALKAQDSGSFAKAETLLIEGLSEVEKLGENDVRVATPLECIAAFYMDKRWNRFGEAEPLLRRALTIREKAQGREHADVASTLCLLASCRATWKKAEAEDVGPLLRRATNIFERTKGKESPQVAKVLEILATWRLCRGDFGQAESALTRALAIIEKQPDPANETIANLLTNLAAVHTVQAASDNLSVGRGLFDGKAEGETEAERHGKQAEACLKRALAILEKIHQPDHPAIAEAIFNLGQLATVREHPAEGTGYLERWLSLQEKAKAPASEKQALVLMMLSMASVERKDWHEAERQLGKAQSILKQVKGAENEQYVELFAQRAKLAIFAGEFDSAEVLLKQGLEAAAGRIGPDDAKVSQARRLMAGRYTDHSDDKESLALWSKLSALRGDADSDDEHQGLSGVLATYASLLRTTNRVFPPPTEADLAYLKKIVAVLPDEDLDGLAERSSLILCDLDDEALPHLARLYNLERLDVISKQPITDAGLSHLKHLSNLNYLSLTSTGVTGRGMIHLARLENLETLELSFTRVDDAGLSHLKALKKLRKLELRYTDITDAGLVYLEGLENLRELDIRSTKVTDAALARLRRARPGLKLEQGAD